MKSNRRFVGGPIVGRPYVAWRFVGRPFVEDSRNTGFAFLKIALFWNFWKNGMIYSNCEMHPLLQFSFNRWKIIQGSSRFHDNTIFSFLIFKGL